ncbi:hypothetical protein [uncultured Aquimarina sp.]|uniref:hypothetical protein n=1 Tax=uncultured Aquimarina sp. TaxID=575652 RepID=UPI0026332781|nr:hypothetical protein [uncultured Aquimarina sp.]
MRLFLCCLIFLNWGLAHSQITNSELIGKWIIKDVQYSAKIISCGPNSESPSEIKIRLKQNYIGASIEFLNTKELKYRDKNNYLECEKGSKPFIGLYDYNWRVLHQNKIEFFELSSNEDPLRLTINYNSGKIHIYLDFIGILFIMEKK